MDHSFDLRGKTALITGSTSGIGLDLARAFGGAGARVIVNGRTASRVEQAVTALRGEGVEVSGCVLDVCDAPAITAAFAEGGPLCRQIDILVNNAGIQHRAPLEDFDPDAFDRVISTNLSAAFRMAQGVARGMIDRRAGSIINICSVQSALARPSISAYAAAKGGLAMLTRAMATEWGRHGIRANGLAPGYFDTEMNSALVADEAFSAWIRGRTPMNRWGNLEELRGPALFLASDAASFVTGQILYVDGGITACL